MNDLSKQVILKCEYAPDDKDEIGNLLFMKSTLSWSNVYKSRSEFAFK